MTNSGERFHREIPAQQRTVDDVSTRVGELLGDRPKVAFRVGGPQSKDTVQLRVEPTKVTRGNFPEGTDLGNWLEIVVSEKRDILTQHGVETRTEETPYRLDTVDGTQRLQVEADGADFYMGSFPDARYMRRRTDNNKKPADERWKGTTEAEAQKVLTILLGVSEEDAFKEFYGGMTVAEDLERAEIFDDIQGHFDRICRIAADYIPQAHGILVPLVSDGRIVTLRKFPKNEHLNVTVLKPVDNNLNNAIRENYNISPHSPLKTHTTFFHEGEKESTLYTDCDDEQKVYLMETLRSLTDERVVKQLRDRKAIQDHIERIVGQIGYYDQDGFVADITKKAFSLSLYKAEDDPYYAVEIENFVDLESDEMRGEVKTFSFSIADNDPILLRTVKFGHYEVQNPQGLPTEEQVEYLRIFLEEVA